MTPSDSPRFISKLTPSSARNTRGSPSGEEVEHEANPAAALLDLRIVLADVVDLE
jgi:hypothetical protein